jgi:hypothetical protein
MLYYSDLQQVDYNNHPYNTDAIGLMRVFGGMAVILAAESKGLSEVLDRHFRSGSWKCVVLELFAQCQFVDLAGRGVR